jgi:hypothetical protein
VVALGKTRPPFYLGLPQTTAGRGGRTLFAVYLNDYEFFEDDNDTWPKQIFRYPENVPLDASRRIFARLKQSTMQRLKDWQHQGNRRRKRR